MDLVGAALRNPINRAILQRLPLLGVKQSWLVAGSVFQAVWNERTGRAPQSDIKDYDVFYFDAADLSWEAEDAIIERGRVLFGDLDGLIEIRNQARVHLWYPQRFGAPCPALTSAEDGIGRFLVRCTCVGLSPQGDGSLRLHVPYGLDELHQGILKPNANAPSLHRFREKAESYRALAVPEDCKRLTGVNRRGGYAPCVRAVPAPRARGWRSASPPAASG